MVNLVNLLAESGCRIGHLASTMDRLDSILQLTGCFLRALHENPSRSVTNNNAMVKFTEITAACMNGQVFLINWLVSVLLRAR